MKTSTFIRIKFIFTFFLLNALSSSAQFNTRLIKMVLAEDDWEGESITYQWSGNRYGVYGDELKYDTSYTWGSDNINPIERTSQTFDASNNILTRYKEKRNDLDWVPSQDFTKTYTENNQILSVHSRYWSTGQNAWVNSSRSTYGYDSFGRVATVMSESGYTGQWENSTFTTNTYGNVGIPDLVVIQSWDAETLAWQDFIINHNSFDVNGNRILQLVERRDFNTDVMENYSKRIWSYDNDNRVTEELNLGWNEHTEAYVEYTNDIYTYTNSGELEILIEQSSQNGLMENRKRKTYMYQGGVVISIDYELWNGTNWEYASDSYQDLMFYDNLLTSIKQDFKNDMLIYPNPAHTILTITTKAGDSENMQLKITDAMGKLVITQSINAIGNSQINVESLQPGIYYLQANGRFSMPFIKE